MVYVVLNLVKIFLKEIGNLPLFSRKHKFASYENDGTPIQHQFIKERPVRFL